MQSQPFISPTLVDSDFALVIWQLMQATHVSHLGEVLPWPSLRAMRVADLFSMYLQLPHAWGIPQAPGRVLAQVLLAERTNVLDYFLAHKAKEDVLDWGTSLWGPLEQCLVCDILGLDDTSQPLRTPLESTCAAYQVAWMESIEA